MFGRVSRLSLLPMIRFLRSSGAFLFPPKIPPAMIRAAAKIQTLPRNFERAHENPNARESSVPSALERFHVGDDVLDLLFIQNIFERRHERIAVFNPALQIIVGDFVVVDGERAALGNSF